MTLGTNQILALDKNKSKVPGMEGFVYKRIAYGQS